LPDLGIVFYKKARHAFVSISIDGLFKLPFVQKFQPTLVWGGVIGAWNLTCLLYIPVSKSAFLAGSFALSLPKARDLTQMLCSTTKSQNVIGLAPFPPLFQNGRNISEKD
jgi:hypothetical protein